MTILSKLLPEEKLGVHSLAGISSSPNKHNNFKPALESAKWFGRSMFISVYSLLTSVVSYKLTRGSYIIYNFP